MFASSNVISSKQAHFTGSIEATKALSNLVPSAPRQSHTSVSSL